MTTNEKENLVEVEVELDDQVVLRLAMEAHRRDITLNQLCNEILGDFAEENKTP